MSQNTQGCNVFILSKFVNHVIFDFSCRIHSALMSLPSGFLGIPISHQLIRDTLLVSFENNLFNWQDELFTKMMQKSIVHLRFSFIVFLLFFALVVVFLHLKTFLLSKKIILSLSSDRSMWQKAIITKQQNRCEDVLIHFKNLDLLAMAIATRTM